MATPTGSRHADASALEALVDAATGILAADSLSDTLGRIAHHLSELLDYDELSVYEVDGAAGMLVPVFALGAYADEVKIRLGFDPNVAVKKIQDGDFTMGWDAQPTEALLEQTVR